MTTWEVIRGQAAKSGTAFFWDRGDGISTTKISSFSISKSRRYEERWTPAPHVDSSQCSCHRHQLFRLDHSGRCLWRGTLCRNDDGIECGGAHEQRCQRSPQKSVQRGEASEVNQRENPGEDGALMYRAVRLNRWTAWICNG